MAINDGNTNGRATLTEMRAMLREARETEDPERIHTALIEVVERLIDRAEEQDVEIQALLAKAIRP